VTIAENVLRPRMRELSDAGLLWITRAVVVCFAILVTAYSLLSTETIHGMVENAYKVTLVAAFVPLAAGVYWKRATTQGALAACVAGLVTWIFMEIVAPEAMVPPQFAGLLASIAGMVLGSLAPQRYGLHRRSA
jgi:Na+/proline symporter